MKPQKACFDWSLVPLAAAAGIVLLRLVIWKFFPGAATMVKEDLSNLIVAFCQLLLGAGFSALALRGRVRLSATGFEWPLGVLLVVAAVSLGYTLDFSGGIRVWIPLVGSVAMFYVLANTLSDIRRVKLFLYFILACALLTSIFGIQEFILLCARQTQPGDEAIARTNSSLYYILVNRRVTSFLGWPNSLAGYLLLILPFAGVSVAIVRRASVRVLSAVVVAVLIGCLLVTFSFLGWLNFLAATIILLPLMVRRFRPAMDGRSKAWSVALGAVFLALFLVVILRKNFAGSIVPRLEYYRQAWHLIMSRPWEGYGYGSFGLAARPMVHSMDAFTNYAHNVYLQWWVECGILGLAGIIGLVGVFTIMARRVLDHFKEGEEGLIALAVVWGLAAFFVDNLFSFTFTKPNIAVHGWAMLGVFAALYGQTRLKPEQGPAARLVPAGGLVICFSSCILAAVLSTGIFFYHIGLQAFGRGDIDGAGRAFVTGSLIDPWSASYPSAAGDAAAELFMRSHQEHHIRLAEANYLEAVRREPVLYNNHLMLSRVYIVLGQRDKAIAYAREARRLSPFEYERDMARMTQAAATPKPTR